MGVHERKRTKKLKNGTEKTVTTYEVTIYKDGFRVYSKSGFKTKKEAKEHESLVTAELLENGSIKKKQKITLNQAFEEWKEAEKNNFQYNTFSIYTRLYESEVRSILGNKLIKEIDYNTLVNFFNERSNKNYCVNKNVKSVLSNVLDYCVIQDYIESNKLKLLKKLSGIKKEKNENEKVLTESQFNTLINELEKNTDFKIKNYIIALYIGYFQGLRVSETFGLEKSDFDFENNTISIQRKLVYDGLKQNELYTTNQLKSKSSKAVIPLAEPLKEILLNWFNSTPFERVICNENGDYLQPLYMDNFINKIAKEYGFTFHYHQLRHTYTTNLINNGVAPKQAQSLLRHSNFNTTMTIYAHADKEEQKDIVNHVFQDNHVKIVLQNNAELN